MTDPYAVWDATVSRATDNPDGLPDRFLVPLITDLRAAGFVTYQSCSGHFQEGDGTLWIELGPHVDYWIDSASFTRIQHVHHGPEGDYWEYWWESNDAREAVAAIRSAYRLAEGSGE